MEKSPIKVVEKKQLLAFQKQCGEGAARGRRGGEAARLGRAVLSGSLQFPPLIGLPAPCLLSISPRHSELGQNRTREPPLFLIPCFCHLVYYRKRGLSRRGGGRGQRETTPFSLMQSGRGVRAGRLRTLRFVTSQLVLIFVRSEERRVGKECLRLCRSRWSPDH